MGYLSGIVLSLLGKRGEVSTGSKELAELFGRKGVTSITADNAMKVATVFACIRLLSETIATLPISLMQDYKGKRKHASDHPLYYLLKSKPNQDMNSVQLKEALMASMCLRGNGYLQKVTTRGGAIVELPFLDASRMTLSTRSDGTYYYTYTKKSGGQVRFEPNEIVNIPYFSLNGIEGITPIEMCSQGIGLAMTAETHASMFYENGGKITGVIEYPNQLDSDRVKSLKEGFNSKFSGKSSYQTAILESGAKFNAVSMTAKDAEFIATRKFQKSEIAAMFNIPPHLVGDLEKATFSNIEQQSIEFEKFTIRPLVTKIEAVFNTSLLTEQEQRQGYYFKFNTDALLRGDIKSRYEAYAIAVTNAIKSPNECRALEDDEEYEGGDDKWMPLNMQNISNPKQGGTPNA